jgi:hypothetical protein
VAEVSLRTRIFVSQQGGALVNAYSHGWDQKAQVRCRWHGNPPNRIELLYENMDGFCKNQKPIHSFPDP